MPTISRPPGPGAEARGHQVVTHAESAATWQDLRLDDGDMLVVGDLRLQAIHTPGHTRDSMSLWSATGCSPATRC